MIDSHRGAVPVAAPGLRLWTWAMWFAVLTALGQVVLVLIAQVTVRRITVFSHDFIWMPVAADVIAFAGAAVVLEVVARAAPCPRRIGLTLSTFLFLFLLGPALTVPRLSHVAALLLCGGLAVQGARMLRAHLSVFDAVVQRTVWPLAAASIVAGLGAHFFPDVVARTRVVRTTRSF